MPKRCIALLLFITLTLAPASGAFAEVMDKINSYSNPNVASLFRKALWFTSNDSDVKNYANMVADTIVAQKTLGDYSVNAYGSIGPDDASLIYRDNAGEITEQLDLVSSPPEYYFTDMVFIQQKYEEALVDLYFYRAESAGAMYEDGNRPAVDEAIAGTYWVAQQNGITYTEEQIQEKFMERLDEQLDVAVGKYHRYWKNEGLTNIDSLTGEYVDAIRSYYLNRNLESFENILSCAFQIEEKVGEDYFKWWTLTGIVTDLSSGLGTSLIMHGNENKNKFTMAPRTVSPVEVSRAEPVEASTQERALVFEG